MSNKKTWETDFAFGAAYVNKSAEETEPEARGMELLMLLCEVFNNEIEETSMNVITKKRELQAAFE